MSARRLRRSRHGESLSDSEDAILFSIQDRPVLSAMGLYYEEAPEGEEHQEMVSVFEAH